MYRVYVLQQRGRGRGSQVLTETRNATPSAAAAHAAFWVLYGGAYDPTHLLLMTRDNNVAMEAFSTQASALEGAGRTVVDVAIDAEFAGMLAIADAVRPSAKRAVERLAQMGVQEAIPTGDNRAQPAPGVWGRGGGGEARTAGVARRNGGGGGHRDARRARVLFAGQ